MLYLVFILHETQACYMPWVLVGCHIVLYRLAGVPWVIIHNPIMRTRSGPHQCKCKGLMWLKSQNVCSTLVERELLPTADVHSACVSSLYVEYGKHYCPLFKDFRRIRSWPPHAMQHKQPIENTTFQRLKQQTAENERLAPLRSTTLVVPKKSFWPFLN